MTFRKPKIIKQQEFPHSDTSASFLTNNLHHISRKPPPPPPQNQAQKLCTVNTFWGYSCLIRPISKQKCCVIKMLLATTELKGGQSSFISFPIPLPPSVSHHPSGPLPHLIAFFFFVDPSFTAGCASRRKRPFCCCFVHFNIIDLWVLDRCWKKTPKNQKNTHIYEECWGGKNVHKSLKKTNDW